MDNRDSFVKRINLKPIVDTKGFVQVQKISNEIAKSFKEVKQSMAPSNEVLNFKKILTDTAKIFKREIRETFLPIELHDFFTKIDDMKEAMQQLRDVETQLSNIKSYKPTSPIFGMYENLVKQEENLQNQIYEKLVQNQNVDDLRSQRANIQERITGFEGLFENNPEFEDIKEYLSTIASLEEKRDELREKTGQTKEGGKLTSIISSKFNDIKQLAKSGSVKELIMNAILVGIRKIIKIIETIAKTIIKLFKEALRHLSDMAKFSTNSYIMSSSIREQMLQYGFTPAQNYAFTQASDILGITSEEDLYWGLQTSKNFRNKFTFYMEKFSRQFEQQSELALSYQEFQIEFKELKLELRRDVIQFLVNNKALIVSFLNVSMWFMKGVMQLLTSIVDFFGGGYKTESERISAASDIIGQYSISNTSNSNVKVDNTYNINGGQPTDITNTIKRSFSTVIMALKGE